MKITRHLQILFIVFVVDIIIIMTGCDTLPFIQSGNVTSQFDVQLVDIGFKSNANIFSSNSLIISGNSLRFSVNVTPKDSFTGEPFRTVQLGNKDIGYTTLIQSTPTVWLVLLSKDGYLFCEQGPLTWTPEQLQKPDESERDYYKIQNMQQQRIKNIQVYAPSSDKATVALLQDSNLLMTELQRKQWNWIISGDWLFGGDLPKEADQEYIQSKFESLFNRYFKLMIVDADDLLKLRYPDGKITKIGKYSGHGSFKTPVFTPQYNWLRITVLTPTGCSGQGGLYYSDGTSSQSGTFHVSPNYDKPKRLPVKPGREYYYTFTIPDDQSWTLIIEESNMDIWIEEIGK